MEDNKLVKVQVWDPEADDEEEIDILELFGYYMSKLPLLIAAVVIGVLMVGFYTVYHQAPGVDLYTAKSKMVVFSHPAIPRSTSLTSTSISSTWAGGCPKTAWS